MARKTKKRIQDKKNIFLVGLLIGLMCVTACAGPNRHGSNANWSTVNNMINSSQSSPTGNPIDLGIHFSISKRSSLNIDIECIADYIQKELSVIGHDTTLNQTTPWISMDWHF